MSYTREQIDTLKAHRIKGVAELTLNGERVRFRSLSEMDRIIREAEAELAGSALSRSHYPEFGKGF